MMKTYIGIPRGDRTKHFSLATLERLEDKYQLAIVSGDAKGITSCKVFSPYPPIVRGITFTEQHEKRFNNDDDTINTSIQGSGD